MRRAPSLTVYVVLSSLISLDAMNEPQPKPISMEELAQGANLQAEATAHAQAAARGTSDLMNQLGATLANHLTEIDEGIRSITKPGYAKLRGISSQIKQGVNKLTNPLVNTFAENSREIDAGIRPLIATLADNLGADDYRAIVYPLYQRYPSGQRIVADDPQGQVFFAQPSQDPRTMGAGPRALPPKIGTPGAPPQSGPPIRPLPPRGPFLPPPVRTDPNPPANPPPPPSQPPQPPGGFATKCSFDYSHMPAPEITPSGNVSPAYDTWWILVDCANNCYDIVQVHGPDQLQYLWALPIAGALGPIATEADAFAYIQGKPSTQIPLYVSYAAYVGGAGNQVYCSPVVNTPLPPKQPPPAPPPPEVPACINGIQDNDLSAAVSALCSCLQALGKETPVDLDQPLAFLFGEQSDEWHQQAANWYGGALADIEATQSIQDLIAQRDPPYNPNL